MKGKDLTGKRFGKLTVLEPTDQRVCSAVVWRCRCECGNEILVERRRLKPGAIFSCGCEPSPYDGVRDLTGYHFGKLLVKGRSGNKAKDGNPLWLCQCQCWKEIETTKRRLITGGVRSCGCLRDPQKNLHYADGTCLEMLQTDVMYKSNTSGVRGVYYNKKRHKWISQIMFKQKCYYLGGYDQIDDAARARAEAEEKLFGDFIKISFFAQCS